MTEHERLEAALRELGARLDVPEPPDGADVAADVRARLEGRPPRGRTTRTMLLRVAAVFVLALVTLSVLMAVSPPVRAGVLNLLRFAGIEFSTDSAPSPLPPTPAPLPGERVVDLPTAQGLSRFPIAVPEELGEPERVVVADGEPPRVVSLVYRGGTVRLDQFDGRADAFFKKLLGGRDVAETRVGQRLALWVDGPHELAYIDRDGRTHFESARLSAKTLIWQVGDVTLRLEGDFTLEQARAIAESVR